MSIDIQLVSIFVSFLYGMFLKVFWLFNDKFSYKNIFCSLITSFLAIFISVMGYILLLYKINYGIFHIYFSFFIIGGYIFMSKSVKNINFKKLFLFKGKR